MTGHAFIAAASRGRLLLDGAMATYVHSLGATPHAALACDELSISDPALVRRVHDDYLRAGADIVRTNTFAAATRDHASHASQLCVAAARLARDAADAWTRQAPERPRFVAGALGPSDERGSHDSIHAAYRVPLRALLDGGVDLVMIETCCAPSHAAAALAACADAAGETGRHVPVILSIVLNATGRLAVSDAPIDDLLAAIDPAAVGGLGINCGLGPEGLHDGLRVLRAHAPLVTCYPSAGLPDVNGRYPIAPGDFARHVKGYVAAGLAGIVEAAAERLLRTLRRSRAPSHNEARPMEYLIKQYPLESGALEIQDIEEYFGEFPRKKTANEIVTRLADREFLILMAEASLPDDPSTVVPVSFKVVHELRANESDPKLADLVHRLKDSVRFDDRKVLYSWIGGTRRDWRGQGHFRALTEESEAWAHSSGFHEVVVKTKNRFYDMRGTLDHLEFDVIKYEVHPTDNRDSKVYFGKQLTSDVLRAHTSARTVVQA